MTNINVLKGASLAISIIVVLFVFLFAVDGEDKEVEIQSLADVKSLDSAGVLPVLAAELRKAFGVNHLSPNLSDFDRARIIARYVYFRMSLGSNPYSAPDEMLLHGAGSCLHFSKVYKALLEASNIRARIYNIYEIPEIGGHNTVEVYTDQGWVLIDPSYGLYFAGKNGKPMSFGDIVSAIAEQNELIVMSLKERQQFVRGSPPPAFQGKPSDLFKEEKGAIPGFDPIEVFSTGKWGRQGPNLLYTSDWTLDAGSAPKVGGRDGFDEEHADAPWNALVGLRDGRRIVSLHELGQTALHEQKQHYLIKGLSPGAKYLLRVGVVYSSSTDVTITASSNSGEVLGEEDGWQIGVHSNTRYFEVGLVPEGENLDIWLSAGGGYVLLNSVIIEKLL